MRILIATTRFPLPPLTGDRLRALRQIEHLRERHEVHVVCLTQERVPATARAEFEAVASSVTIVPHSKRQIAKGILQGWKDQPLQVMLYQSLAMTTAISRVIQERDIDVVLTQLTRVAPNVAPGEAVHVVDYVDALSLGLERRKNAGSRLIRPFAHVEAQRMKKLEVAVGRKANRRIVTSPIDAKHLEALGTGPVDVVPVGVSDDFFEDRSAMKRQDADYDIVFTGNLGYASNIAAAEFLVNEVVPLVLRSHADLRVLLVGARPARRVRRLASDNVEVLGPVPDLRNYLRRSRVACAPMQTGSGVQLKLLEAMAMGLPMVTTPLASEPFGVTAGRDLLVGTTAQELAAAVEEALASDEFARQIGTNGQEFVRRQWRWSTINTELERLLVEAFAESK